mgnify:CR=1 FL=1
MIINKFQYKLLFKGALLLFSMAYSCQDTRSFLYGCWQAYKTIETSEVALFPRDDPDEAQEYFRSNEYKAIMEAADSLASYLINKEISLHKNYVIVDGVKYKHPIYQITQEQPDTYLYASHRIPYKEWLGIGENTDKIQVIALSTYADVQEMKIKDLNKVRGKMIKIPCPNSSYTFYIERLISYNNELIMSFSILKNGEEVFNHSWQKYLCLKRSK